MRFRLLFSTLAICLLLCLAGAVPVQAQIQSLSERNSFWQTESSINLPVTLCHIPPGNPSSAHTIQVAQAAVPAHLAHGDLMGECPYTCDGPPASTVVDHGMIPGTQWDVNGHYYTVIHDSTVDWHEARASAESMGGYLATITSAAENLWISSTFGDVGAMFIGGFQPAGSVEPDGEWTWLTSEEWNYTNWGPNEPSNSFEGEDVLEFGYYGNNSDGEQWNDIGDSTTRGGYIVEWDTTDSDGDGIADDLDLCLDTAIPESVPTNHLGVNRWALVDEDGMFDTTPPPGGGNGPDFEFSVQDTGGCSCEQIIEAMSLGWGHTKFGCSTGVMLQWTGMGNDGGGGQRQPMIFERNRNLPSNGNVNLEPR